MCVLNGALRDIDAGHIAANDRGWTLADGCFETMRVVRGAPLWLADHLRRLRMGLHVLGIAAPDEQRLRADIERLLTASALATGVLRVQISRGVASERGLAPSGITPTILITLAPLAPLAPHAVARRVIIARSTRRNEWSPLTRCKALSAYADHIIALREAQSQGADDALLLNTAGTLVCGTVANLWVRRDGVLLTPPVSAGALPGVVRDHLLRAAPALGVQIAERIITPADVYAADEVLLTNVLRGIQSVIAVDGQPIGTGTVGPLAQQLWDWFQHRTE